MFFDDILVYSKTWDEHISYLNNVFGTLIHHQLFVCLICQQDVEYLGRIISAAGVSADPKTIWIMETWPVPTNTTTLRFWV